MPVDPRISMGVTGGATGMMDPQMPHPANPLELAGQAATVINQMNQIKLFNAQFAARMKAGEIMASAPSPEAGIQIIQQDPSISGIIPDVAASMASTYSTMASAAGEVQKQGTDVYNNTILQLPRLAADPTQFDSIVSTSEALASPFSRPAVRKSLGYLKESLFTGLSSDPEQAKTQFLQRVVGASEAAGAGPAVRGILASPEFHNVGDRLAFGTREPAQGSPLWLGGGTPGKFTESNDLAMGFSPQTASQGDVPIGGTLGPYGNGGRSNGLALPAPAAPAPVQSNQSTPTPNPAASSFDGSPLFDESTDMTAPTTEVTSIGGAPTGLLGGQAAEELKRFTGPERDMYQNAGLTKAQLGELQHNIDAMAEGGGFLTPGTAAPLRVEMAKFVKMIGDVTGRDTDEDVEFANKIASAEDAMKLTQRLGISYLNTTLGEKHKAAETIRNITEKGVPGIQNTTLGAKLMIDMIGALNDRGIDQYKWKTEWARRNKGNLIGADQRFNETYPADSYINRALTKNGLNQTQFLNRAALDDALAKKLITPEQYEVIRQNKGKIPAGLPKAE